MTRRILFRLLQAIPILFGILTISFLITNVLPADPARQVAGPFATDAEVALIRSSLGLDQPVLTQYVAYLDGLRSGDLGRSVLTGRPVLAEMRPRVGATLLLVTLGSLAATFYGITLGALSALAPRFRTVFRWASSGGLALPDFVVGLVLIYVVFFKLGWAPSPLGQIDFTTPAPPRVTGAVVIDAVLDRNWDAFVNAVRHLVLPVITLAVVYGSPVAKVAERSFQEARNKPFVEYARLAGLGKVRVFRYMLRSALPATITLSAAVFGYLVGAMVLVEIVFSWDGAASFAARAILERDLLIIQAFILFAGVMTLLIYLTLDIIYSLVDPRTRA